GQITSAFNYVTTDNIPMAYTLEGHNESVLTETLKEMITKNSFDVQSLSLYNTDAVPEDAGCLIINAPTSDISAEEADRIIAYLEKGGSAFIVEDGSAAAKPNLERVLEYYGVGLQRGIVIEESTSNFFYPYPNYLAPNRGDHDIMETLNAKKYNVMMAYSGSIVKLDSARGTVNFEPLLTTSDASFLRVLENGALESISMAEGDIAGPCYVGVAVSEEHGGVETKLVVYSSAYTTTDEANASVNGNNYELVTSSMNWLAGMDSSIAVDAKSFAISYLQVTSADVNRWMIITVVAIPLVILVFGFVVWFRRRRK
ncbi:MAG: Gldg family protein, partial [Lachnospiraceae bacterium]|nr:Gldg family protein [Lachnospiraceae bacterium]